ncbi:MAG: hypothetical protein K2X29_07855 [Candidatus Obscuribacterales bacterium]|nr:hypothetical protein [Candidatus Obscuribacterales bacterium]
MVTKYLLLASFIATISMLSPSCVKAQTTEYFYKSTVVETAPEPQTVIYRETQIAEPITVVETRPSTVVVEKVIQQPVMVEPMVVRPIIVEKVKIKKDRPNKLIRLGTMPLRLIF